MNSNDNKQVVFLIFVVIILFWGYTGWGVKSVAPTSMTVDDVYSDTANLDKIKAIALSMSKIDRERLSTFYKAFATVVKNDDSTRNWLSHSVLIKETNLRAGVMCFGNDLLGKYPGLSEEIDLHLKSSLGLDKDHRSITLAEREKAVKALNELSVIFQPTP